MRRLITHMMVPVSLLFLTVGLPGYDAAKAADVRVIAGAALSGVIGELGPQFERSTGHKLVVEYGILTTMKRQIESGEPFDLAIVPVELMDDVTKQGRIAADTRTGIARVGMGVGVRAGAAKPDISSADAFKRAMLNAKSITYVPGGATGTHLVKVFERLGITDAMKAKTKPQQVPARIGQAVADGEAELGLGVISILLSVRGVELAGPLPPELQHHLVLTAGVGSAAKQPDAAKALIKHLTTPEAAAVIKAKDLDPVSR